MATAYTSILKLALPVQGELSGTWGDVVNDNITSMVEEAIAGRAVINTWTTNSHTLTSADGTTSESRCAMLEFTDTGTALTGDATVVCPAQSKIYICKNDSGQKVTIKTSAGTGVAIADGQTMFVFCDSTNVVEAITSMSSLKLGTAATSVEVTAILDEDTMSSDSPTSLATQQSIKAYVDSQVTAQDLDFGGDSGTGSVDLDSQTFTIAGTSNEIETSASGQTLTVGLPDAVTVTTSVTTPTVQATNVKANDGTTAVTIADSTGQTTIADAVLTTADINAGTIDNATIGATTASTGAFTTVTSSGNTTVSGSLITDTIAEETATAGVTVDGLLVKDTGIGVADASGTDVAGSDVTVRGGAGTGTGAGGELLFKVAPAGTTGTSVNALATGMKLDSTKALYVDTINELTSAAGVTIDSVLLKDDVVNATDIETSTISANDGTTAINIADSTGAVDIDTSLNVDGTVTADGLTVDGSGTVNITSSSVDTLQLTRTDVGGGTRILMENGNDNIWRIQNDGADVFSLAYNTTTALDIDNGGDISFYDSAGSSQSFFWDASEERLGIGTTSPSRLLDVSGVQGWENSGTEVAYLNPTATGTDFGLKNSSGTLVVRFDGRPSGDAYFNTGGNVGIGTNSPSSLLDLEASAGARLRLTDTGTQSYTIGNTGTSFNIYNESQAAEAMRITSNGTLLVGKTIEDNTTQGIRLYGPNGFMSIVRDSDLPFAIYRKTNDGEILRFSKDSTTVGSIGSYSGTDTYVTGGSGNSTGVVITSGAVVPSGSAGATNTNVNLGLSVAGRRFKDLNLSNAVIQSLVKATTTATTQVAIETFAHASHDGAKVVITAATSADTYVTELLIATNGTTAVATEYGQVGTGSALATYDVDISGSDVRILATPASTTSTTFRVAMTLT